MKTLKTIIAIVALAFATVAASAASYVIGISPNFNKADRDLVLKSVLLFVLETASAGDGVVIYDALNRQPVAKFAIPNEKLFEKNARARAQRLAGAIAALHKFLANEHAVTPELTNVIHVPEFLALAASHLRNANAPLRIILIGSPFYMSIEEPSFNMNDAFPSDAHIAAEQKDSVFGTAHKKNALAGVSVHYTYLRECFLNDYHRERIGRFWSLFIREQSGNLVTFAPDLGLTFQRARQNVQDSCINAQLDPNDSKLEMRCVKPRSIPLWLDPAKISEAQQSSAPTASTDLIAQAVEVRTSDAATEETIATSQESASAPQNNTPVTTDTNEDNKAGKIKIGITWSVPVDLDLYVKPTAESKELSYKSRITAEGRHFREDRVETKGFDYEYIQLTGSFDVSHIRAWVNLYSGRAKSVQGTVVIVYEGKTFRAPFSISGTVGNMGFNANSRDKSKNWAELKLEKNIQSQTAQTSP